MGEGKPRKPRANESVSLRRPKEFIIPLGTSWKVTARYAVQTAPNVFMECVRVHAYTGQGGMTLHFCLDEFDRLFKAAKDNPNG